MALNRNREALVYIKHALAIKHNKTLYKYLIELESKSRNFNTCAFKNISSSSPEKKNYKNSELSNKIKSTPKKQSTEEYRKIFENSDQSINCCQNEYFNKNGKRDENDSNFFIQKLIKTFLKFFHFQYIFFKKYYILIKAFILYYTYLNFKCKFQTIQESI